MLEQILRSFRHLMVIPVIGSLLLTLGVIIMSVGLLIERTVVAVQKAEFSLKAAKKMSITVIETIDLFLVAAVGYITAVGLYKLFVSQKEVLILKRVRIEKLADLEAKIIGVVVAALAVSFLGDAATSENMTDLLYFGIANAVVIGVLVFFLKFNASTSLSEKGAKKSDAKGDN